MSAAAPTRMAAAGRRAHLLETAARVFVEGSYRGTTTAEIARAAGISEPIIYRHFASKRDLYIATLDHVWENARAGWVQALTEASDDAEIRRYLKRHLREVHDFVADVIRRSQERGGIPKDRDADAEAWIFISIGLLATVSKRLGGMLDQEFPHIVASRRRWIAGRD